LADRFIGGAAPIDYGPGLLFMPFGFHLTMSISLTALPPAFMNGNIDASGTPPLAAASISFLT
jgi:hypothetical protein